jgi:SdpC family antimicrobial peptide
VTNIIRKTIAACVATSVLALAHIACDPADDAPAPTELREGGYSGKELYLGIFLGQGDVAGKLPTLWGDCGPNAAVQAKLAKLDSSQLAAALADGAARSHEQGDPAGAAALEKLASEIPEGAGGEYPIEAADFEVLLSAIDKQDPTFFDRFAEDIQSGDHTRIDKALEEARDLSHLVWEEVGIGIPGEDRMCVAILVAAVWAALWIYEWAWVDDDEFDPSNVMHEELLVDEIAQNLAIG